MGDDGTPRDFWDDEWGPAKGVHDGAVEDECVAGSNGGGPEMADMSTTSPDNTSAQATSETSPHTAATTQRNGVAPSGPSDGPPRPESPQRLQSPPGADKPSPEAVGRNVSSSGAPRGKGLLPTPTGRGDVIEITSGTEWAVFKATQLVCTLQRALEGFRLNHESGRARARDFLVSWTEVSQQVHRCRSRLGVLRQRARDCYGKLDHASADGKRVAHAMSNLTLVVRELDYFLPLLPTPPPARGYSAPADAMPASCPRAGFQQPGYMQPGYMQPGVGAGLCGNAYQVPPCALGQGWAWHPHQAQAWQPGLAVAVPIYDMHGRPQYQHQQAFGAAPVAVPPPTHTPAYAGVATAPTYGAQYLQPPWGFPSRSNGVAGAGAGAGAGASSCVYSAGAAKPGAASLDNGAGSAVPATDGDDVDCDVEAADPDTGELVSTLCEDDEAASFKDGGVPARVVAKLRRRGITSPRPVHARVLKSLAAGDDVIVQAECLTGKTEALITHIMGVVQQHERSLQVIVPVHTKLLTHTLATRIREAVGATIVVGELAGPMATAGNDARYLQATKPHVLCATPHRLAQLLSHVCQDAFRLRVHDLAVPVLPSLRLLGVDEADELLQDKFDDDMGAIMNCLDTVRSARPSGRVQRALFATTLPTPLHDKARRMTCRTARAVVVVGSSKLCEAGHVEHMHTAVDNEEGAVEEVARIVKLHMQSDDATKESETAETATGCGCMVIVPTRRAVAKVATKLKTELEGGGHVRQLTGGSDLQDMTEQIRSFNESGGVLVSTDIVSRGITFPHTSMVVSLGVPHKAEMYVHRSGCAARAAPAGDAARMRVVSVCYTNEAAVGDKAMPLGRLRQLEETVARFGASVAPFADRTPASDAAR